MGSQRIRKTEQLNHHHHTILREFQAEFYLLPKKATLGTLGEAGSLLLLCQSEGDCRSRGPELDGFSQLWRLEAQTKESEV